MESYTVAVDVLSTPPRVPNAYVLGGEVHTDCSSVYSPVVYSPVQVANVSCE